MHKHCGSITEAYNSNVVVALGLAGRLCHDESSGSGRKPQGPHHAVWILGLIGCSTSPCNSRGARSQRLRFGRGYGRGRGHGQTHGEEEQTFQGLPDALRCKYRSRLPMGACGRRAARARSWPCCAAGVYQCWGNLTRSGSLRDDGGCLEASTASGGLDVVHRWICRACEPALHCIMVCTTHTPVQLRQRRTNEIICHRCDLYTVCSSTRPTALLSV